MFASIPCPGCQLPLEITEELRGQMVQCPQCSTTLHVPPRKKPAKPARPAKAAKAARPASTTAKSEPSPEQGEPGIVAPVPLSLMGKKQKPDQTFEDIESPPEESESWRGRWEDTWTGLMQINVAIGLWYASAGFAFFIELGDVLALKALSTGPLVLTLGSLAASALGVLGLRKCASIPQRTGAKGIAMHAAWSGAGFAGGLVLYLLLGLLADATKSSETADATVLAALLTVALGLMTVVLVTFFLVLTSHYLDAKKVKDRLIIFSVLVTLYPLINITAVYIVYLSSTENVGVAGAIRQIRYFTLVTAIGLGIWLITLITSLASRIRRHFILSEETLEG